MDIASRTPKNLKFILLMTALFVTVGQLGLTIYLPAMPEMSRDLHVSVGATQSTMILFLLPFGFSQLFYGFLSDRYGRKRVLFSGLIILLVGSLLLVFSFHSFTSLLVARFIQGMGAGSVSVLARAIVRDCYHERNLAAALSVLIMSVSLTPAVAPFLGGWIQYAFGWHMIFILYLIYTAIVTILIGFFLPETLSKNLTEVSEQNKIFASFKILFKHEYYLLCVAMIIFVYSVQIIYLAICPFIFEGQLKVSPQIYGSLIIIPALGYLLGNYATKRFSFRYPLTRLITMGLVITFASAIGILIIALLHVLSIGWLLAFLFLLTIGLGLIFPNVVSLSLKPFAAMAGAAAALSGFLQMLGTSIVNAIINAFHGETVMVLGSALIVCVLILAGLFKVLKPRVS